MSLARPSVASFSDLLSLMVYLFFFLFRRQISSFLHLSLSPPFREKFLGGRDVWGDVRNEEEFSIHPRPFLLLGEGEEEEERGSLRKGEG